MKLDCHLRVLPILFTLLITFLQLAAGQNRCPGGFFIKNGRCAPCPPGFFRPAKIAVVVSSKRCFACAPGTFNPVAAASTKRVCRQCPVNTFSLKGSATCTPCPLGLRSNRGASVCLACGPGTRFSPRDNDNSFRRRNRSKCLPCPRGTFSTGRANLDCESCPRGYGSPKMSTSKKQCHLCPPGKHNRHGNGCLKCYPGKFKPGLLGECQHCPRGYISNYGAVSCTPCPKGTRPSGRSKRCIDCPPGTTTAAEGGSYCRAPGEPCPVLFFENASGNCESCKRGFFYNVSKGTCEICPPGAASKGRLQESCEVCPPGKRPEPFNKGTCICNDGTIRQRDGSCKKCPPGTYINSNVSGTGECVLCSYGTFQDEEGAAMCKPCPDDLVAPESGMTKCIPCPNGLVPSIGNDHGDEENVACVVPTNACPPGWVSEEVGATIGPVFGCKRVWCKVGTPREEIGKTCLPCDPGFALNEKGACRKCARDEVSKGGIITKCEKCPRGLLQDYLDPSKCSCRRSGFARKDGVCKKCEPGSFNPDSTEICKLCRLGTFQAQSGQTSCEPCVKGTFAAKRGSKACKKCPSGTSSGPRSAECIAL